MTITKKPRWPARLCRSITRLEDILRGYHHPLVAFSGGVDSSFLAVMAQRVLGRDRVVAVTVAAPMIAQAELDQARIIARRYGLTHRMVRLDPLSKKAFQENPPDRCYHCKKMILDRLGVLARKMGCDVIIEGSHAGDAGDYRPGRKALTEAGARSPLCEAGFDKTAIRQASRCLGLPTADKPSMACLASRIPYGTPITNQQLKAIDRAETALRKLGFAPIRVRAHGPVARIEVSSETMNKFLRPDVRRRVAASLKRCGFFYAAVDLDGYRTGSMNAVLRPSGKTGFTDG